jgi:amidohydrolase
MADEVRLVGMVRCLNPDIRAAAPGRIEAVVRGVTQAFGATYTLQLTPRSPVTMNAPELVRMSISALQATLGIENVILQKPHMGSEDFALFAERVPGFYFFLGVRNESQGITSMLHTPEFDVDEACLPLGVETMSRLVVEYLSQRRTSQTMSK